MAKREVTQKWFYKGGYIYHIITPNNIVYIGQSMRNEKGQKDTNDMVGAQRIIEHITNAYYGETPRDNNPIYAAMKKYRLCDLQILIYPAENDFGIQNFDECYTKFSQEWTVASNRNNDNQDIFPPANKIDFAEMFHILRAAQAGIKITNDQMGGQNSGYRYIGPDAQRGLNKSASNVLMRTMSPQEALNILRMGGNRAASLNAAIKSMYKEVFSSNWAKTYTEKYAELDTYNNHGAANNITQSWGEFVNNQILPLIAQFMTKDIIKSFYEMSKQDRKTTIYEGDIAQQVKKLILNEFLTPREQLMRLIVDNWFANNKTKTDVRFDLRESFNFEKLSDYFIPLLERVINKYLYGVKKNKADPEETFKTVIPVRMTAVLDLPTFRGEIGEWLSNTGRYAITAGIPISESWMQHRSLLLFNHLMKKVKPINIVDTTPLSETINMGDTIVMPQTYGGLSKQTNYAIANNFAPITTNDTFDNNISWSNSNKHSGYRIINDTIYYFADHVAKPDQWLSKRLHDIYRQYAPGYNGKWYEFYRPMINIWRQNFRKYSAEPYRNNENFHNADNLYIPITSTQTVIYQIKNAVFGPYDWGTIKIY